MRRVQPRDQFARNVRRARTKKGWSQEHLGEVCGLHRTEISLLERAGRDPRLETIVKIARALDIPASELLTGIR